MGKQMSQIDFGTIRIFQNCMCARQTNYKQSQLESQYNSLEFKNNSSSHFGLIDAILP